VSFAINLRRGSAATAFLVALDQDMIRLDGRPNLIKDSRLPRAVFDAVFPEADLVRQGLRDRDPRRRFRSELSERLRLQDGTPGVGGCARRRQDKVADGEPRFLRRHGPVCPDHLSRHMRVAMARTSRAMTEVGRYGVIAPWVFTYSAYTDVLAHMYSRLRSRPPNVRLAQVSGRWILPIMSPFGA